MASPDRDTDCQRCPNLIPFLRTLCEDEILDCKYAPDSSGIKVHTKIQNLVYLAKHFECPGLDYEYNAFIDGPHSPSLTNDLYGIDWKDDKAMSSAKWPRLNEFLGFVHKHDQGDWLMIAATLSKLSDQVRKKTRRCREGEDERACVLRVAGKAHPLTDPQVIADIYEEISGELLATPLSA